MMTKGELLEKLEGLPDSAIIYIEADHGQVPEQAGNSIRVCSTTRGELPYMDDEGILHWEEVDGSCMTEFVRGILIR